MPPRNLVEVQLRKGKGSQPWYLVLYNNANETVLATSEGYFSKWNAKRAARKNFPGLELVDRTTES
jgi:uncharacterized protein YegP (UPF0339 family)